MEVAHVAARGASPHHKAPVCPACGRTAPRPAAALVAMNICVASIASAGRYLLAVSFSFSPACARLAFFFRAAAWAFGFPAASQLPGSARAPRTWGARSSAVVVSRGCRGRAAAGACGRPGSGGVAGGGQHGEERADPEPFLGGVTERAVGVHGVPGAASGPGARGQAPNSGTSDADALLTTARQPQITPICVSPRSADMASAAAHSIRRDCALSPCPRPITHREPGQLAMRFRSPSMRW